MTDLDGRWAIVLGPEHLALETAAYATWDSLRARMEQALDALGNVARPRLRERMGLRYVNHVPADEHGAFTGRVRSELLGLTDVPGWREAMTASLSQTVFINEHAQMALRYGSGAPSSRVTCSCSTSTARTSGRSSSMSRRSSHTSIRSTTRLTSPARRRPAEPETDRHRVRRHAARRRRPVHRRSSCWRRGAPDQLLRDRLTDEVHRLVTALPDPAPIVDDVLVALPAQQPLNLGDYDDLDDEDDPTDDRKNKADVVHDKRKYSDDSSSPGREAGHTQA